MNFHQLELFLKIAETMSFSKAAEAFGYSQAKASEQIKQLEDALDVKLFKRHGRSISLSVEGIIFQEYAKNILDMLFKSRLAVYDILSPHDSEKADHITSNSKEVSNEISFSLTNKYDDSKIINVDIFFESSKFLALLSSIEGDLVKFFPNVKLKITVDHSTDILRRVFSRKTDIGFLIGNFGVGGRNFEDEPIADYLEAANYKSDGEKNGRPIPGICSTLLKEEEVILCRSPKQNCMLNFLIFPGNDIRQTCQFYEYQILENRYERIARKPPKKPKVGHKVITSRFSDFLSLLMEGKGFALLPKIIVSEEIHSNHLCYEHLPIEGKATVPLFLVYPDKYSETDLYKQVALNLILKRYREFISD